MAPPAKRVSGLIDDLLKWLAATDVHPLIAGSVFHYEFEFIHPFMDGNGRMGRLWQTIILSRWQPMLAYLPVETVICDQQAAYYRALETADEAAEATIFIEFILKALQAAMDEALQTQAAELKTSGKTSGKILQLLRTDPRTTIPELAVATAVTERTIERNIQKLQKAGALKRIGPAKGGYWEVLHD